MKTYRLMQEQKGASAVEFALVLWLLLLIVFGIVEWGLYLFNKHIITNASRAGARQGIIQASPRIPIEPSMAQPTAIRPTVRNYSESHLVTFATPTANDLIIDVNTNDVPDAICTKFGDDLEVIVTYDYTFLVFPALAKWVLPQTPFKKVIRAQTAMKCE